MLPRHQTPARLPRVVLSSVVLGILVGAVVAGFEELTVRILLDTLHDRPLWEQALAPAVGLVVAAAILRWFGPRASTSTSDEYIRAFHERHGRIPLRQLPAKLLAGAASIGSGGALGLEGPSIYAGANIGQNLQDRMHRYFRRDETKTLLTAGAAAGVAAIFQAPATGVIFALESPYRDDLARRALLPSLFAAASSYLTFVAILGTEPVFPRLGGTQFDLGIMDLLGGALVGIAAGLGGRLFAGLVRWTKTSVTRAPLHWRLASAGATLAGLAVVADAVFDDPVTLGPGGRAVEWLTDGNRGLGLIVLLLALRVCATLATLAGGGTGGLFIPLAVQGVLMGAAVGHLVGEPQTSLYPTLGLAAFLGAGYRAPIAAVMFVAESTGSTPYVVPALIAAAMSQLVAGNSSVASYQRSVRLGHLERRFTLPISSALVTDVFTVPPDATLTEFVYVHVLGRRERAVAVVDGGHFRGMCSMESLADLERSLWDTTTVGDVMRTDLPTGSASWTLRDAVAAMEAADIDILPIVDPSGIFVGLVAADDILKLDEILDETGG
ncbi:MAG: chloride channel protein [Acidimicrobiales bacterium]|nr:chloride channel protein [Acidimicrobiales bacterium]